MLVRKSFQFRLRPTKKQAKVLQAQLDECRWLYNELLEQRKLSHEELDISLSKYQQLMFLPFLKEERPALDQVHSQVLQNVVDRLDKAFQGIFPKMQSGRKTWISSVSRICIDTIAFAIRKVDLLSLAKSSNFQKLAIFALRCIVP